MKGKEGIRGNLGESQGKLDGLPRKGESEKNLEKLRET